jgi:hypothetical protein
MPLGSAGSRNISRAPERLPKRSNHPTLEEVTRAAIADRVRYNKAGNDTLASTQIMFLINLAHAERLHDATMIGCMVQGKLTRIRGKALDKLAKDSGIGHTIAYQMVKLHPQQAVVLAWGKQIAASEGRWPTITAVLGRFGTGREREPEQAQAPATPLSASGKWQFRGVVGKLESDDRPTPQYIYDYANQLHHPDWDVCGDPVNTKVPKRFFNIAVDALKQEWRFRCGWMNPPYTKKEITAFLKKASDELKAGRCKKIVALLPVWTEAPWFFEYVSHGHIIFLANHIRFGNSTGSAPFPSMLVILTKESQRRGRKLSAEILTIPKR